MTMSDMAFVVRAAVFRGLPALVDGLGGDSAALLARFGVPVGAVDSEDALILERTADRMLGAAAAELGCPDLGLRLAGEQGVEILGPLSVALVNATTLTEAIAHARRFLVSYSPGSHIAQVPDPSGMAGVVGLLYENLDKVPRPAPQSIDHALGLFHRIVVLLMGGPYGLRAAHLPHAPLAPIASYTGFFGADVRFDRPSAVLRIPSRLLDTPLPGANPVLREMALDYLTSHVTGPNQTVTDQVRLMLARSFDSAPVDLVAAARLLHTHPRTLQRRLTAEGTGFNRILDDVRRDAAHQLITVTDLPFAQIAARVGLTGQSALSRAVQRWYATSPRALRRDAAVQRTAGRKGSDT